MTAEIVQFVPKANPNRDAPLCNAPDLPEPGFTVLGTNRAYIHATGAVVEWSDTAPSEYVLPSDDCA